MLEEAAEEEARFVARAAGVEGSPRETAAVGKAVVAEVLAAEVPANPRGSDRGQAVLPPVRRHWEPEPRCSVSLPDP